jgi:light-independent protochlorophyllide reductase subunit B
LPSYQRKENFGADETFFQIVKKLAMPQPKTKNISCNLIGPTALGFRHRDDVDELEKVLQKLGIEVNVVAPMGSNPADIRNLGAAHFNVLMYPETGESACRFLEKNLDQPYTKTVPIGVGALSQFVSEIEAVTGLTDLQNKVQSRLPWYSASVDSTYLTGKRVFIFGDGSHVIAAAKIAADEIGFEVVGLGCFNREMARPVRAAAKSLGLEALITDDYLEVEAKISDLAPELILGSQMERHIGKRLGIPCAVISAPVHVQDFPARYSPQMGPEGANVIFDTWVHPLVMGLEEHLLTMFREDFEFSDANGPSHHAAHQPKTVEKEVTYEDAAIQNGSSHVIWMSDAEKELRKIPFFVRGKAKRNTERYAVDNGVLEISIDTLYEAKAHYAR